MKQRPLWAIVLAGGEGSRLAEKSRRLYGTYLPKQFLSFGRERTFLQATVDRLQHVVAPERTVVVVGRQHESLARQQLSEYPALEIVPQPRNLGTGPGVLLPLVHVLRRDASADVALVPSDHDFRSSPPMLEALLRAQRAACHHRGMVLIGAAAEAPASDLGWIVPRRRSLPASGVSSIREFVEKPSPALAASLFARGALWNTMLSVTPAGAMWALARQQLPRQTALLERYAHALDTPAAAQLLELAYRDLPSADFSRDVVAAARGLWVTPMSGAGWSDCGTPERLEAALGDSPASSRVVARSTLTEPAAAQAS